MVARLSDKIPNLKNTNKYTVDYNGRRLGKQKYSLIEISKSRTIKNIGKIKKRLYSKNVGNNKIVKEIHLQKVYAKRNMKPLRDSHGVMTNKDKRSKHYELKNFIPTKHSENPKDSEFWRLLRIVEDEINTKSSEFKQYKKFQITMTFMANGSLKVTSTVFSNYNTLFNNFEMLYNLVMETYDLDDVYIEDVVLRYYNHPRMKRQLVLASSNNQKELREFYIKMIEKDEKKLIKFKSKWKIGCVNTTKNCFLKSVLHCIHKTDDSKLIGDKIRNINRDLDFSKQLRTLDEQAFLISGYYKCKINVYNHELDLEETYSHIFR